VTPTGYAATTANWINSVSANWTVAADWSTNPVFPQNNSPAGVTYQAVVAVAGGPTINSNITIDGLTINATGALVTQSAGVFTVGSLAVSKGTYRLSGGTLSGGSTGALASVTGTGQFQFISGTLDHLTISGVSAISLSSSSSVLTVTNGLDLSGSAINLSSASAKIAFDGPSQAIDHLTIDATPTAGGPIQIGGTAATAPATLTLGSSATIHGDAIISDFSSTLGNTLVNNGTINADISGQTLSINDAGFTNNGTAEATGGGTLSIKAASWSNPGTISTTGTSTLNLGGGFTTSRMGTISPSATSTVNITGTLDNTGNTLTLAGVTGTWNLAIGATIHGGTISLGASSPLHIKGGTISDALIAAGTTISVPASTTLSLGGAWSNQGTISGASSSSILNLGGSFGLAAVGTVTSPGPINLTGTLTMASTDTLTRTAANGLWTLSGGGTINGGNITAGSMHFGTGTLNGVHIAGGDLNVDVNAGLLNLQGTPNIDTNKVNLTGSGAGLQLGTSQTLTAFQIYGSSSNLLVLGGPSSSTLTIASGALLHGGLTVQNAASTSDTLINDGTINADLSGQTLAITSAQFTNNATTEATAAVLSISAANWTNSSTGTLSANSANAALTLSGAWSNAGVFSVSNGATLNLGGTVTLASLGTITRSGTTTINLTGTLNLSGQTCSFNSTTGSWQLNGGTINGGTLSFADGQQLVAASGTLNGARVSGGDFNVSGFDTTVTATGGLTVDTHNLNLSGDSETLLFDGTASQTMNNLNVWMNPAASPGAPDLNFGGPLSNASSVFTIASTSLVHGSGVIGGVGSLVNQGAITADISKQTLQVSNAFLNYSSLKATDGATLQITGTFTNEPGATITADAGSVELPFGNTWVNQGTITLINGASLYVGGSQAISTWGTINQSSDSWLHVSSTINNAGQTLSISTHWAMDGGSITGGTIALSNGQDLHDNGGVLTGVQVTGGNIDFGDMPVGGDSIGSISGGFSGDGTNSLIVSASGGSTQLDLSDTIDNITISGTTNGILPTLAILGATIGSHATLQGSAHATELSPGGLLQNNGTINANLNGQTLLFTLTSIKNAGLMEASNGGILEVSPRSNTSATLTNTGTLQAVSGGRVWILAAETVTDSGTFDTSAGTLQNDGALQINASATVGQMTGTGSLGIGNGATLQIAAGSGACTSGPLTFSGSGRLDLTNDTLTVGNTASSVLAEIISGQIFSSDSSSSGPAGAVGFRDLGSGHTEVRFTLLGDTDLDGIVNVADLANLAGNFGKTSGQFWISGDFDYNGNVNVADLADLAGNFGQSLSSAGLTASPALLVSSVTTVPEPGTLLVFFAVAALCIKRRRRPLTFQPRTGTK
jgi:hypothetical protein